uniref:GDT1 family protein n=1 Tax=Angiostrongylus cantonensis TaxID=6313 RepID=A0A0K0DL93_ANGCA
MSLRDSFFQCDISFLETFLFSTVTVVAVFFYEGMWLKVAVFTLVVAFAVADEIRSSERFHQVVHTPVEHHRGKLLMNPHYPITRESIVDIEISFYHGFLASLSVTIVSELGDKTWFIAVILAMRHSRLTVFSGAMSALALMTVLSGIF